MAKRQQLLLISDMHLTSSQPVARLDNAVDTCLRKFEWLLQAARKHNAAIVQAGDMFDKPRDWYLLPRIAELLRKHKVTLYSVYGQHDTYMHSKENRPATSLGVLAKAGLVHVLGPHPHLLSFKKTSSHGADDWVDSGWALYGASWQETVPTPQPDDRLKMLVRHAPIALEPAYMGHENIDAAHTLERMTDYDIILCGDVHRSFHIQKGHRHILNTGPMFRYSAEEYNFTHIPSFVAVDTTGEHAGELTWYEMPCESAEEVLSRDHIQTAIGNEALFGFMQAITTPAQDRNRWVVNITQRMQHALQDPNVPKEVVDLMFDIMDTVSKGAAIHGTA
jgi:DNA repair exonuclease SbcCD nuclease subunit